MKFEILKDNLNEGELAKLKTILLDNKGQDKAYFKINQNGQTKILETGFRVNNNLALIQAIKSQLGELVEVMDNKR